MVNRVCGLFYQTRSSSLTDHKLAGIQLHPQYKLAVQIMILVHLSLQMFYLPMALAIPPPAFLVHKQFNLLYQFWIHTEVGRKRGEGVCVYEDESGG